MGALRQMRRLLMAGTFAVAGAAGGLGGGGAAVAAEPHSASAQLAEDLGARAQKAYRSGDLDQAIALYLQAYDAAQAPEILYNIAFIYEKLGDGDLASDYYRRVMAEPASDEILRGRADKRLKKIAARAEKARSEVQAKANDAKPHGPTAGGGSKQAGDAGVTTSHKRHDAPSASKAPWVMTGIGGGVLAGGIVMGIVATNTEERFHAAVDPDEKRDLQAKGQRQAIVADVMMFTGGAAVVGGVIWALLQGPSKADDTAESWHISPSMMPGGAMITIGGGL